MTDLSERVGDVAPAPHANSVQEVSMLAAHGIVIRISHRFQTRRLEWFLSFILVAWGAVVLHPDPLFDRESWQFFFELFGTEQLLGWLMLLMGLGRLSGLIINGSLPTVTPWIRMVSAGFGFLIWLMVAIGFALSAPLSTWAAVYPFFALAELSNVYYAGFDARARNHGYH